jgi:RNA polymerase sigma factor (sigma-70 family)
MGDPKSLSSADALTREQFYGLLARLHQDPQQRALKYEELHLKLVKFFQWSYCSAAEDLADETLTRTARKLCAGNEEVADVEAFVWGIARRIRQEGRKKDFKTIGLSEITEDRISDAGASLQAIERKIHARQEQKCLRNCLQRLTPEDQELFLAYRIDKGHYLQKRKELAEKFGLTASALRVRIIRLREKLEKCVARCLGTNHNS